MIKRVADQIAAESQTGIVLFVPVNLTYHIITEGPRKKPYVAVTHPEIQVDFLFGPKVPVLTRNPSKAQSFASNNYSIKFSPRFSRWIGILRLCWHFSIKAAIYQADKNSRQFFPQ